MPDIPVLQEQQIGQGSPLRWENSRGHFQTFWEGGDNTTGRLTDLHYIDLSRTNMSCKWDVVRSAFRIMLLSSRRVLAVSDPTSRTGQVNHF
jgi:hypothetical protein